MLCLNFSQINMLKNHIFSSLSLNSLTDNEEYETLKSKLCKRFGYKDLNTFSFCKDGFLGLFLELGKSGKIAVCKGESEAVYLGAKAYEQLGFEIVWINLQKDGKINLDNISSNKFDYLFLSSYVMDTFVKTELLHVKTLSDAKIISNASADFSECSDAVYFDTYKLSGFSVSGVLLHNGMFEQKSVGFTDSIALSLLFQGLENFTPNLHVKEIFLQELKEVFKDDMFLFVNQDYTLEFCLHVGFKGIKARELIRSLVFEDIFITNGEGCALGLSRPSRIIEQMDCGLDNKNAISFSFNTDFTQTQIKSIVKSLHEKYKQIRALNE